MSLWRRLSEVVRRFRTRKLSNAPRPRRPLRLEALESRLTPTNFTSVVGTGLTNVAAGDGVWGDYDGDGFLDVLVAGQTGSTNADRKALVYRGDGTGAFTLAATLPIGIQHGAAAWGDIDNDGDLDIALAGNSSSGGVVAAIYRNDGNDTFTDINAGLTGVGSAALAWGDFNNDGRLDLIVAGLESGGTRSTRLYRNDGGGTFTEVADTGLEGVSSGAVAWGDLNNDGYLDLALSGDSDSGVVARIYTNQSGDGTFSLLTTPGGLREGSLAWGDFDNDGDLDLIMTGYQSARTTATTRLIQNTGGAFAVVTGTGLAGVGFGAASWGDFNNDGILDVAISGAAGNNETTPLTRVYTGAGDGTFTTAQTLTGERSSSTAWGDFNNDGRLDLLVNGYNTSGLPLTALYQNTSTASANAAPDAPTGLTATFLTPSSVTLSWTAPADPQQPTAGLSYALRVGTTPGGSDIVNPMANATNGFRQLPRIGFVQTGDGWTLTGLTPGVTYYWSVQAIDGGLMGGAFAAESTFNSDQDAPTAAIASPAATVTDPAATTVTISITYSDTGDAGIDSTTFDLSNLSVSNGATVTGFVVDGDTVTYTISAPGGTWGASPQGEYVVSLTGDVLDKAGNPVAAVASFSTFSVNAPEDTPAEDTPSANLPPSITPPVEGDRTTLGAIGSVAGSMPRVQTYNADGSVRDEFLAFDESFRGGVVVAVGDADGDGTDDILVGAGVGSAGGHVKLFDGNTGETLRSFLAFPGFSGAVSVALADLDGDGFAEILVGAAAGALPHVKVFDGRTGAEMLSFLAYEASFAGGVSVAGADVDGDGTADLVVGPGVGRAPEVRVFDWRTGELRASFLAYDAAFMGGVSVAAGDVTGDGVADIVTGVLGGAGPNVKVFAGGTFEERASFMAYAPDYKGGVSVSVRDADGDGSDDIITRAEVAGGVHVKSFTDVVFEEGLSFLEDEAQN